jgi:hypothetical protein
MLPAMLVAGIFGSGVRSEVNCGDTEGQLTLRITIVAYGKPLKDGTNGQNVTTSVTYGRASWARAEIGRNAQFRKVNVFRDAGQEAGYFGGGARFKMGKGKAARPK